MKQIRRIVLMASLGAVAAIASACTGGGYATTGTVYAEKTYDPYYDHYDANVTMVPVRENVWVVEGRSQPVFYGSGSYWRYRDGTWYRSRYVNDGYVRVRGHYVPPTIRGIHRPTRYIRYRAPERTRVRVVPRTHFRGRVDVRTGDRYQERRYRR